MTQSNFRKISIPQRQHGYSKLKSQLITSQSGFDQIFNNYDPGIYKLVNGQKVNDTTTIDVFKNANIDYNKENIVLIANTQPSSSNTVSINPQIKNNTELHCDITVQKPGMGTCMMAYYCFAYAYDKKSVQKVFSNGSQIRQLHS